MTTEFGEELNGLKKAGFVTAEFGDELSGQIYGENVTLEFGGELRGLKKAGVRDRRVR